MAPLGYIEILDAKGRVMARFAVEDWPITIGRAYTNRVIIDDPFVSPEHVRIERDVSGQLYAKDLNSENGLREAAGGKRVSFLSLASGAPFQIGHTVLRYCELQHPVAPTAFEGRESRVPLPPFGLGLLSFFVLLAVLLLANYFDSYERFFLARSVTEAMTTLLMVLSWAALWSLLSRVIVGRFHYAEHFALASGAILISLVFTTTAEWLEFVRPSLPALWIFAVVGSGALLGGLVFGHLAWAAAMTRRSRLWAGVGTSAAVIGTVLIADYAARHAFTIVMEYSAVIKPLDAEWLPAVSVEQFIGESEKLKKEIDVLAQKAKQTQP